MSCREVNTQYRIVPYHIVPCCDMSCRVVLCNAVSCCQHVVSYHDMIRHDMVQHDTMSHVDDPTRFDTTQYDTLNSSHCNGNEEALSLPSRDCTAPILQMRVATAVLSYNKCASWSAMQSIGMKCSTVLYKYLTNPTRTSEFSHLHEQLSGLDNHKLYA